MSRTDKDRPYDVRRRDEPGHRLTWRAQSPPDWFVNHRWSAPDRLAVRLSAGAAVAEHRAGLEPEAEPPTFQHKHGAIWEWN